MEIIRENGKVKAMVIINEYGSELLSMTNGRHFSSHKITPELAKLIIAVLQEYLKK